MVQENKKIIALKQLLLFLAPLFLTLTLTLTLTACASGAPVGPPESYTYGITLD